MEVLSDHGGSWRRPSLIEDAKFDSLTNAEYEKTLVNSSDSRAGGAIHHEGEDEVFNGGTHPPPEVDAHRKCSLVFGVREAVGISRIFKSFENNRVSIQHVETRKSKKNGAALEFFVTFEGVCDDVINVVKSVKQSSAANDVNIISEADNVTEQVGWIPYHISDLDNCQHILTKFDPDLDQGHPGFSDMEYRTRRAKIANMAFEHEHGKPIQRVEYTQEEIKTWGTVYRTLSNLYPKYACNEHIKIFKMMEKECGYGEFNIPQLEDVSHFLRKRTGFQLRPVAGLLSARDFLASMAHRVFQCTQYVRHSSKPDHTVEPDVVHELIGHVPMLADPLFADFAQEIGLASIGVSDADIEKFSTLYWFTVEFGLCKQDGQVKAYGAGLLSAYGELLYAMSDKPEKKVFEPSVTAVQEYDDQDYQNTYFIAESFEDMKEKVRKYGAAMKRPHELRYDPITQTIHTLDNKESLEKVVRSLKLDINHLQSALRRIENMTVN